MIGARAATSASASASKPGVSGTGTGVSEFTAAKTRAITNVGSMYATRSPGLPKARKAQLITSSEPHPTITSSGATPTYSAIAERRSRE